MVAHRHPNHRKTSKFPRPAPNYCTAGPKPKVIHNSKAEARRHIRSLIGRSGRAGDERERSKIEPYQCPAHPEHWHVGHPNRKAPKP